MKTTKKIFAAFLAVMLIALSIPFTVSAADGQSTLTLNCDKAGEYEFNVYQLATINATTGTINFNKDVADEIKGILNVVPSTTENTAKAVKACDKAEEAQLGVKLAEVYNTTTGATKALTVEDGIYYIRNTKSPSNVKAITNSIVTVPGVDNATGEYSVKNVAVDLAKKIDLAGEPKVEKKIVEGKEKVNAAIAGVGKIVTYQFTATPTGSIDSKLKDYTIIDTMSKGLDFNGVSKAYFEEDVDSDIKDQFDITTAKEDSGKTVITLKAKASLLSNEAFYNTKGIVVEYSAKVNENAVTTAEGNPNKVSLTYTSSQGQKGTYEGNEVKVYCVSLGIEKVDANNTATKLSGATFELFVKDGNDYTSTGATLTTSAEGKGVFTKNGTAYQCDDKTEYYAKETAAPAGYVLQTGYVQLKVENINTTSFNGATVYTSVPNTHIVVPSTGGMGTTMFTIGGAALIVCAGVLFLIVRKKKAVK